MGDDGKHVSLLFTRDWQSWIPSPSFPPSPTLRGLAGLQTSCSFMRKISFFTVVSISARGNSQSEPHTRNGLCCLFVIQRSSYCCSVFLCLTVFLLHCWRLAGDHIQAKVLGNAPYGIYKYKFPRAIRTEDNVGAKVFFFKAFLQSSDLSQAELKADYLWVTKKELGDYLKSEYLKKVNRFLLDL